ncbi:MAG TPA: gliding motility-associated C-terminal domain-containing protein, partial [Chitinophagaceae bacterium]|nr:gliding motility-associated C-terminal domain-containing protein [Chitinophagaceae bacterium]
FFSIQAPTFASNNPVTCNGNEGYITISGLAAGATYSVSYTDDGVTVGPFSLTANASGQIVISGLNAGLYSNFSLLINGCTTNLFIGIVLSNPIFIPTFTSIPPICAGTTPPTLSSASNNGINGAWNPAVINNNATGTYTFTPAGGQCGIPITITVTVIPRTTPTFSFGTSLNICAGGTVPTLPNTSLNGINGTWSPAVVDNNNPGTYTFTPNAGQCANPATFTVTVTPNITPTFSFGTSLTICAGGTVPTLSNTSSNGINGTWSPSVVNNNASGTYTFTPTASQCALPGTFTVTVTPNITPTFSFGTLLNICAGGTVPTLPTTSTNGITGTWSPSVVNSNASGTYTFTPTAGQCALPTTFTVTVTPNIIPTFSFGTSLTICAGGAVPTLPITSTNGITGTWSPSVVNNNASGTYTFTPTAGQCALPATFTVTVNPNITPSFDINQYSICAGSIPPVLPTTSLEGITGTWSPAAVSNTTSGIYIFTPNPGQCAVTTTVQVDVIPNITPTFNFGTSLSICSGGTVPALPGFSNEGFTGVWSPAVVSNTTSGIYTFTPEAGQCATPVIFTVTVNSIATPTFSFGTSLNICAGGSVPTLPTTSTNGITGTWSPSVVNSNASGTYTFTSTGGSCVLPATFTVTVSPIITPTFSFGTSLTICSGTTVPSLPTTSTNGIAGTWSQSVIDNQNSSTYTFTPTAGQCANPTNLSVTVIPTITPVFNFGTSLSICAGGTVPTLASVSDNGVNGTWSPSVVNTQSSGVYTFTPTPIAGQCFNNAMFTVTVNPIVTPTFSFGTSLSICVGGSIPALSLTSQNGVSGTWSPSSIDNLNSGTYTFTPTAGQCANPLALTVSVNEIPTIVVRADTTLNDGDLMSATFFTGTPVGISYNWTNSNPSIGLTEFGTGNVPAFIALNKGNNPVTATVTVVPMNGGCAGTAGKYKITVKPLNKDVFVPNVFSPNGDGKNDKLFVYGNYVDKVEMRIFNQWGEQIIIINSLNQGWDGTHRGKPQPVGVYVYALKAVMTDGRVINLKGSITLLR